MEDRDKASIELVRKLIHRVGSSTSRCECPECTAIRRVATLAAEAVEMKAARQRKKTKLYKGANRED